jgi:hypothetical protein
LYSLFVISNKLRISLALINFVVGFIGVGVEEVFIIRKKTIKRKKRK